MKTHPRKFDRRAKWMGQFQTQLQAQFPDRHVKVDWDTAIFMFNRGDDAFDAALKVAQRIKSES